MRSSFSYTTNLTKQGVTKGNPWQVPTVPVSDEIRNNKSARQTWYRNPKTEHCFYTGYEGVNPNARITAENPVLFLHALVADLDDKMTQLDVDEALGKLNIKPKFVERSLGGGARFVWVLSDSVRFPSEPELCADVLDALKIMLGLDRITILDNGSWNTPQRLYASGGMEAWNDYDQPPLQAGTIRQLIWDLAGKLAKKSKSEEVVLARIEELIKKKWPNWSWPGDFCEGSQGPSWWIEGSTSEKSAIIHGNGVYTFAAHAEKTFYFWDDILGAGTVAADKKEKIQKSVEGVFYDGQCYYSPRTGGGFKTEQQDPLRRMLQVQCGLSTSRTKKCPTSEVDQALAFIEQEHRVDGAAPFVYRKPGIVHMGRGCYLNTVEIFPIQPQPDPAEWGPSGQFPWMSEWLEKIFRTPEQLKHFLCWFSLAYNGGLSGNPHQGQAIFLAGDAGIGKSLLAHRVIGYLLGGFADASKFLSGEDSFGGELFSVPVWNVDDQRMGTSPQALRVFTSCVKKAVADRSHAFHVKFRMKTMVEWMGRTVITCNLDAYSQSVLPALEDSITDKVCFYRLLDLEEGLKMPDNFIPENVEEVILKEIPAFARWLADLEIPADLKGDARYRIRPYQDDKLVANAYQNSGSAGHQEIVVEFMREFLRLNEDKTEWTGSATQLLRAITAIPGLDQQVRSMNPRSLNMHLSALVDFPALKLSHHTGENDLRIWTISLS